MYIIVNVVRFILAHIVIHIYACIYVCTYIKACKVDCINRLE